MVNKYIFKFSFFLIDFFKIVEKFDSQQENLNFLFKKGVNQKSNKESLIAIYLRNNSYQKLHFYEFPLIKENRWKKGAKSNYDIPQYIKDIPEEYPPICTMKEAGTLRAIKKKEEREKEKEKNKKLQLESKNNNNESTNNTLINNNKKNSTKKCDTTKEKKYNNNLEEPLPNEMHKYCHLCKKPFDNYIRHINSKGHKETALKYTDTFKSIKNVFHNINSFWNNKKDNNGNIKNNTNIKYISDNLIEIEEKVEFKNDNLNEVNNIKQRILSQIHQSNREGCKAKKKLIDNNSQQSTTQSSPMMVIGKRRKNEVKINKDKSKSKKTKINNKSIKEFLIRGEFIISKNLKLGE